MAFSFCAATVMGAAHYLDDRTFRYNHRQTLNDGWRFM
jgi:hypothetical protein